MVKRKFPRRKTSPRGRFQTWRVSENLALGTLAQATVIAATLLDLAQDAYLISADLMWTVRGLANNESPILVGLSNGDLTTTEIQEAIDASPDSQSAIIELERARRPVRTVGHCVQVGAAQQATLNDGKPVRTKIKFPVVNNTELDFWARNESAAAPLTTGAVLEIQGLIYGTWK